MACSMYGVIMAGGRGTRFWPLSTMEAPKQFLKLTGERTMLQETAHRFSGLCLPGEMMVVTGSRYRDTVMQQLPWLFRENLLLEPSGRNTAACIGWAAQTLVNRGMDSSVIAVVPSDHVIDDPEGFRETLRIAAEPALDGMLVTIGITPDHPATGYGYLEMGESLSRDVFRVNSFREKPDENTASEYLRQGNYLWNAGMFLWRADVILREIQKSLPLLYNGLLKLGSETCPEASLYNSLQSISIDFGVMETASNVAVVPARFQWNDIGDWPSARKCGVGRGEILKVDSDNVTVWNQGKLTVIMGLSGVSIIETDSVTLVMEDSYSQKLKEVVARMEEDKPHLV